MAFVTQRLNDYKIQVGREEIVRLMPFGSNWQTLRIAMLGAVVGTASFGSGSNTIYGLPQFTIGVCQGAIGCSSDLTTDALLFNPSNSASTATWTYASSGANNYFSPSGSGSNVIQKIGGTATSLGTTGGAASGILGAVPINFPSAHHRLPFVLDILKNSLSGPVSPPTYTYNIYMPTNGQLGDISEDTFFDRIQTFGIITGTTAIGGLTTIAPSGNLLHDSVCFFWGRHVPTFEVSVLAVIRFG